MRFFLVLAVFAVPLLVHAQQSAITAGDSAPAQTGDADDSVRAKYIQQFPHYFFLYPVLKQRALNFELARADRDVALTYKPNNTYSLALGMYLFEVGLELGFAIPLGENSIERYGETKARDIQLDLLTKRWGVDAFYQHYSGFYLVDRKYPPTSKAPFPQRPDIRTRNFGATFHYVFNSRKFSFASAYNFSERQLYRNGSFVLFATLNTFRVLADSSIVNDAHKADFGPDVDFTRLRYTTFSIAPGYTYTFHYRYFFFNGTLTYGPAHHWINYDLAGSKATRYDIAINAFFGARVAIGYNGDRLFGGVTFLLQGSRVKFNDVTFSNNNSLLRMVLGYRFRETGILKKRFWDLLPFTL